MLVLERCELRTRIESLCCYEEVLRGCIVLYGIDLFLPPANHVLCMMYYEMD